MKLIYDDEALIKIEPGPALEGDDVAVIKARVEAALLRPEGRRVRRSIFFSVAPLRGWWRYRDVFQILPAPVDAPTPPDMLGERAFVVETTFSNTSDAFLRIFRGQHSAEEVGLLLSALLAGFVHGPDSTARRHWVILPNDTGGESRSACLQEGYIAPGFNYEADALSATEGIPPIMQIPATEYYSRHGITMGYELDVPASLGDTLDRFYGASPDERRRCLRFGYWFRHARRVSSLSASASCIALIQGIEALIPPPAKAEETCPKCKRPMATSRFREFVEQYAPGTGSFEQTRSQLYRMRSRISHGGGLLWSDARGWSGGLHPRYGEQMIQTMRLWRMATFALVNYLNRPLP